VFFVRILVFSIHSDFSIFFSKKKHFGSRQLLKEYLLNLKKKFQTDSNKLKINQINNYVKNKQKLIKNFMTHKKG